MVLERRIPAEMTRKYLGNVAEEYRLDRPSEHVLDRTIRLAISFDGEERWRIDYLDDSFYVPSGPLPPGSFEVFDGKRIMQYHADPGRFAFEEFFREAGWGVDDRANTYEVLDPGATPLGDLSWDASPGARRFWSGKCLEAEALGLAEIAGWTVQRIRCGPWDLWIDVETGLLLRRHLEFGVDGGPSSEDGVFGIFWGETQEVVELELDPTFSDDPFVFTPPEGSTSLKEFYERKPPTSLIVGDRVPAVELPLLGGGRFDLTSTRGAPTALYFWADWCEPCVGDPIETFDEVRAGSAGRAHLVSVATIADRGSVEAFVAEHALTVPVAFDHDGTVLNDMLQAEGIPLLLLVDADGRLSGAYLGGVSGEELRAILEAFVAGDPLPGGVAEKEQLPA
jgi:peroxiredoxin